MRIELYENQVVRDGFGKVLRILWLPPGGDVAMIDIGAKGALPYWLPREELDEQLDSGTTIALVEDPTAATVRVDSSLTASEITIRDRRLEYILPLIDDPTRAVLDDKLRGGVVIEHVRLHGGGKKSVYAYLGLWWCRGQLANALVPAYSSSAATRNLPRPDSKKLGRPRYDAEKVGINVTPDVLARMQVGRTFLNNDKSVSAAYQDMLFQNFSEQIVVDGQRINKVKPDHLIPSEDQFIYHIVKKISRGDVLKTVKGDSRFERRNRPRTGTSKDMASGPGAIYQIDATIADIYLRSHKYPDRLIGRPVLYIVIDVYTRMIVGFTVALSGPSWEIAKLALENAMTDKVAYCAALGRKITEDAWPSHHVCRQLVIDRGTDVAGTNGAAAAKGLGYKRARLPPYRPDWKGLVESRFNLMHEGEIKWVPGATHGRERGESKHQLDAVYTMATFTELMLNFILHYNRSFHISNPPSDYISSDARPPTPLDLWRFGCQHNGAPQKADLWRVQANLLHVGIARETDRGLLFSGLHYQSDDPAGAQMFRRLPGRRWASHEIRFDPRDMASIKLSLDRGASFETFRLTPADREFTGWTQDEVKDLRAAAREGRKLAADDQHLAKSQHEANQADLTRRVMAETAGVRLTPVSAVGIRDARAEERRDIQRQGAWTSMSDTAEMPPIAAAPRPAELLPEPEQPPQSGGETTRMKRLLAARATSLKNAVGKL